MAATTSTILLTYTIINILTATTLADYASGLEQAFYDAVIMGTVVEVCHSS
jgi:hypothetical protein